MIMNDTNSKLILAKGGEFYELHALPGFSKYLVDVDKGLIYSVRSERFLNPSTPNFKGYIYTTLTNDEGETIPMSVHSIIMSAYTQMDPSEWIERGLEIDHVDENKSNNRAYNLRLVTRQQQYTESVRQRMGKGTRLSISDVQYIRYFVSYLEAKGKPVGSDVFHMLADKYDKDYYSISRLIRGESYADVGLTQEMKQSLLDAELTEDLRKLKEVKA